LVIRISSHEKQVTKQRSKHSMFEMGCNSFQTHYDTICGNHFDLFEIKTLTIAFNDIQPVLRRMTDEVTRRGQTPAGALKTPSSM